MVVRLHTADEVIDILGGTGATARLTGRTPQAVSNWRAAGRIPAETFLIFADALDEKRASAPPSLWSMVEKQA